PAKRSRQRAPGTWGASQLKSVSRTRSGVGRISGDGGKRRRRPRQTPPMMRSVRADAPRRPGGFATLKGLLSLQRWIRASLRGPARASGKKRGFLSEAPPPAAAGHIALRKPAPRKPGVSIRGHPLGGAKRCFAESHRLARCPVNREALPDGVGVETHRWESHYDTLHRQNHYVRTQTQRRRRRHRGAPGL